MSRGAMLVAIALSLAPGVARADGAWLRFGEGAHGTYRIYDADGNQEKTVEVIGSIPLVVGLPAGRHRVVRAREGASPAVDVTVDLSDGEDHSFVDPPTTLAPPPPPPARPIAPPPPPSRAPPPRRTGTEPPSLDRIPDIANYIVARHEIVRAERARSTGIVLLTVGLGGVFFIGGQLGLGALLAKHETQAALVSVFIGEELVATAFTVVGAAILAAARRDLAREHDDVGATPARVLVERARGEAQQRRKFGRVIGVTGGVLIGLGTLAFVVGSIGQQKSDDRAALDGATGSFIGMGLGLAIGGGVMARRAARTLADLDAGRLDLSPELPQLRFSPTVLPGGGGLALSGSF